jgi:hypothetical protein
VTGVGVREKSGEPTIVRLAVAVCGASEPLVPVMVIG